MSVILNMDTLHDKKNGIVYYNSR